MYAEKNIYRSAYTGFIDDYAGTNIKVRAYKKDISIYAEDTTDGHVRIKSGNDLFIESLDTMNLKSGGNFTVNTTDGSLNLKASSSFYAQAASGTMNIKASGNILNTGSEVHLNSTAASSAGDVTAADPESAVIANIAQTFELLVTDLPNPDPADPPLIADDIHGLALNANDTTYGSGGENIRDLQDTLADMSSGIVAHTGTYPTDVGAQTWTGYHTVGGTAGVWSGYDDTLNSATYKLGPRSLSEKRPEPAP